MREVRGFCGVFRNIVKESISSNSKIYLIYPIENKLFTILVNNSFDSSRLSILIPFIDTKVFITLLFEVDIKYIQIWFEYFAQNSADKEKSFFYEQNISLIIYRLLLEETQPLEHIIKFIKNDNMLPNPKYLLEKEQYIPLSFKTIADSFWSIYFGDKIDNIKQISNFFELDTITQEDISKAIELYPIDENLIKYYELNIQLGSHIKIWDKSKQYEDYVITKFNGDNGNQSLGEINNQIVCHDTKIRFFDNNEKIVSTSQAHNIFWCMSQEFDNKDHAFDEKLQSSLTQDNYQNFIEELKKLYIEKTPDINLNIINYLFSTFITKESLKSYLESNNIYETFFIDVQIGDIALNQYIKAIIKEEEKIYCQALKKNQIRKDSKCSLGYYFLDVLLHVLQKRY